jgi:hypothetical protein
VLIESKFIRGEYVDIDPFAANPLIDDVRLASPSAFAQAAAEMPAPKMFDDGTADYPAFLASGLDPSILRKVVYTQRHFVAALDDASDVYAHVQHYGRDASFVADHADWRDAVRRVNDWATGNTDGARAAREHAASLASADENVSWLQQEINKAQARARTLRAGQL